MPRNKKTPFISVIIPALHEGSAIRSVVSHVQSLPAPGAVEILVVDGAPEMDTLTALSNDDAKGITSPAGRARQMNIGALAARGKGLLFLHADTLLPRQALHRIKESFDDGCPAGAFDLGVPDDASAGIRYVVRCGRRRSRRTRAPYGDQAQFFRRDYFLSLGGYKNIPLMEDLELMTRIKESGDAIHIHKDRVTTSPRRWEQEGTVYCTARNLVIRTLYHAGVPPRYLARFYRFAKRKTNV